jgi:hypothetical protein
MTSDAEMATLMNNGGRLTPLNPNDRRCGFTGLPRIPCTRSNPTCRRKSALGGCLRDLISPPIDVASCRG